MKTKEKQWNICLRKFRRRPGKLIFPKSIVLLSLKAFLSRNREPIIFGTMQNNLWHGIKKRRKRKKATKGQVSPKINYTWRISIRRRTKSRSYICFTGQRLHSKKSIRYCCIKTTCNTTAFTRFVFECHFNL